MKQKTNTHCRAKSNEQEDKQGVPIVSASKTGSSASSSCNFNGLNLAQQNKDFYGYTIFTIKFNDVPIRLVTEKDAEHIVKGKYKQGIKKAIDILKNVPCRDGIDYKKSWEIIEEAIEKLNQELKGQ